MNSVAPPGCRRNVLGKAASRAAADLGSDDVWRSSRSVVTGLAGLLLVRWCVVRQAVLRRLQREHYTDACTGLLPLPEMRL